jgi:hypothetical protein
MKVRCRDCYHEAEVHNVEGRGTCACGCVRLAPIYRAAREARQGTWIVDLALLTRREWVNAPQQRVKAAGHAFAAITGR